MDPLYETAWIDWANFTPLSSLLGGVIIGLAALFLMATLGRIAGISGIAASAFFEKEGRPWRIAFLIGIIAAPMMTGMISGEAQVITITNSYPLLIVGGLLVGFGTRFGGGCTSGHGICGISRLSKRSIAAVITFMATAIMTVTVMRHLL